MNKQNKKILRVLLIECFLSIVVYFSVIILCFILIREYCDRVIWFWDDPTYRFLKFVEENSVIICTPLLLIGCFGILYFFFLKMVRYLDEVARAIEKLSMPSGNPIVLNPNLSFMENKLNLVREKTLQERLATKNAEQRKNELVIYLAHDLKTPLTSVIGYLTLLNDEKQISEELRQKYLSIARKKAERLEELINEFFEITRFNLSNIALNRQKVNMSLLLEQLVSEFEPLFLEKGISYSLQVSPEQMVFCDAEKMQRVFDNLLRNAVNYSFINSCIEITTYKKDEFFNIQFMNHGYTIPREKLEHVFDQFFRIDSARESSSGGSGLGLAIAKEIVEHHGGWIRATSELDKIFFEVSIPIGITNEM